MPFQPKAALLGWVQGIWVAQSTAGEAARRSWEMWARAPAQQSSCVTSVASVSDLGWSYIYLTVLGDDLTLLSSLENY